MRFGSGSALLKVIIVALVALVMLVPLGLLRGLVQERAALRAQAVASVARGWAGRQLVSGPVIVVPVAQRGAEDKWVTRNHYLLPETLAVDAVVDVQRERRKVGIYEVPVYVATIRARAHFSPARQLAKFTAADTFHVYTDYARVLVPLGDPKGVRRIELARIGAGGLERARGFPVEALDAPLPLELTEASRDIELTMEIAGTEALSFLPLAHATNVKAKGNWPHPGFASGLLPTHRQVTDQGFEAGWQMLDVNRSYGVNWFEGDAVAEELKASAFGIDLVQPVDLYQQVTRSVKYAGLFVSLSLLTLFLFEQITRRALHPIEYSLLALALSVFYLLLLALSEHVGFACAYLLAAAALSALIAIYLSGVLRGRPAGAVAGTVFGAVYGLLYLLVTSEDYALLAGSLGLFALLATVMLVTRRIEWYGSASQSQ